jgi:protein gp37
MQGAWDVSDKSRIEWTEATWNVTAGCAPCAAGCAHCYAARMTRRLAAMGRKQYQGLVGEKHFNGVVRTMPDNLTIPLRWRKPRRIFVDSMSDLFHPAVPFEFIHKVYVTMDTARQHTFQVLTKRPERRNEFYQWEARQSKSEVDFVSLPLRNVWEGASISTQADADANIPHLRRCPAALRFLSIEPLLGPIDLCVKCYVCAGRGFDPSVGADPGWPKGESGETCRPGARPCNVEWIRSIVAQCQAAGVPTFVKQDSGHKSGAQGRIPDDLWVHKEFPR